MSLAGVVYFIIHTGWDILSLPVMHGHRAWENYPIGSSLNKYPSRLMTEHEVSHSSELNVTRE